MVPCIYDVQLPRVMQTIEENIEHSTPCSASPSLALQGSDELVAPLGAPHPPRAAPGACLVFPPSPHYCPSRGHQLGRLQHRSTVSSLRMEVGSHINPYISGAWCSPCLAPSRHSENFGYTNVCLITIA